MTAPPFQNQETEERDIIIPGNLLLTQGTVGTGQDDGLPKREAVDADIAETPDRES